MPRDVRPDLPLPSLFLDRSDFAVNPGRYGGFKVGKKSYEYKTLAAAQAEANRRFARRTEEIEAVRRVGKALGKFSVGASSEVPRWGFEMPSGTTKAQLEAYRKPLWLRVTKLRLQHVAEVYNRVEVMRIIDRACPDVLPILVRMLETLLERQTEYERMARLTKDLNFQGLNAAHPEAAKRLMEYADYYDLRSKDITMDMVPLLTLQYRFAYLLQTYAGRQLPEIMSLGAVRHGVVLRGNPFDYG